MTLDPAKELTVLARFYLGNDATVAFDRQMMILTLGERSAVAYLRSTLLARDAPRADQFITLGKLAWEIRQPAAIRMTRSRR